MNPKLLILIGVIIFALASLAAACGNGDDDDGTGSATASADPNGTSTASPGATSEYCADELVDRAVDQWIASVTLLAEEDEAVTFQDEAGFREDVEKATRDFCEYGPAPPLVAAQEYCLAIVRAIDPRLSGPATDRDEFLNDYYDTCDNTDQPSPAQ